MEYNKLKYLRVHTSNIEYAISIPGRKYISQLKLCPHLKHTQCLHNKKYFHNSYATNHYKYEVGGFLGARTTKVIGESMR